MKIEQIHTNNSSSKSSTFQHTSGDFYINSNRMLSLKKIERRYRDAWEPWYMRMYYHIKDWAEDLFKRKK